MNASELLLLLKEIAKTKDKAVKASLILDYDRDITFLHVIKYGYDFFKQYNIKSIKVPDKYGELDLSSQRGMDVSEVILDDLYKGRVTDRDINKFIREFLEYFNEPSQLILIIILKNHLHKFLDITFLGMNNIIFGMANRIQLPTVRDFEYGKVRSFWKCPEDYTFSELHKGNRVVVIKSYTGVIKMYHKGAKSLLEVHCMHKIMREMKYLLRNTFAVALSGFVYSNDNNILKKYGRVHMARRTDLDFRQTMYICDVLPLYDFLSKDGTMSAFDRYDWLLKLFSDMEYCVNERTNTQIEIKHLRYVEQYKLTNTNIDYFMTQFRDGVFKGLVMRQDAVYVVKASNNILKFKKLSYIDLEVIEVLREKTNYNKNIRKGDIKSIVVRNKGKFVFVENGLKNHEFQDKYKDNNSIRGKTITIGYLPTTQNLLYSTFVGVKD